MTIARSVLIFLMTWGVLISLFITHHLLQHELPVYNLITIIPQKWSTATNSTMLYFSNWSGHFHHQGQYRQFTEYVPPEMHLEDKHIIYVCNSSRLCGGLADRQEGIVTSYLISQMLRRKFGIIMTKGCDFSNYVIPHAVKWLVNKGKLHGSSEIKRLIDNKKMGYTMRDEDLEEIFDKDVTYYEGNIDYVKFLLNKTSIKSLHWARDKEPHDIFRQAFAQLFQFAHSTSQKYQQFITKTKHFPLICVHLRIGKSKTLHKDDNISKRRSNPEVLIQFLKTNLTLSPSEKLFVATDSEEVRQQMKSAFPDSFLDLDGPIVHVDRYDGHYNCSGLEKAILDQFILATCDTLIVSISGFSRIAAYLRGTDDRLYLAGPQIVTKTTRLTFTPPY